MDLKLIREQSIETAKQLGLSVSPTLPLLETGLEMRGADEAISRLLAMNAVAATAYGFEKRKAIEWLNQEALSDSLSEQEKHFVLEGMGQPEIFKLQVESMWALAWALGITNELNFAKDCDNRFVMTLPNLKQSQSSADFCKKANPRPLEQVVAACDLAYCLHWAIRQSELTGKGLPGNLKPYVVAERRRALEWLLSKDAWDEVSLDT
ncbi:MAG TPA: DUF4272 domain-containing protein [Verrucomicrobiae bacterium]|nr:DUF4272 domain-containing protein [Verrucomicrobiae bacterium]